MARKSGWQQFADSFNAVYGTFRDVAKEWETDKIMKELPIANVDDMGEPVSYSYGGKTYDKQITPDELRGLQYNRLGDVLAKYGDVKGAMEMRLRNEDLIAKRDQNKITQATLDKLIQATNAKNNSTAVQAPSTDRAAIASNQYTIDTMPGKTAATNATNQITVDTAPGKTAATNAQNNITVQTAPGEIAAKNATNNSTVVQAHSKDAAAIAGNRADEADANIRTNTAGLRQTAAETKLNAGIGTDRRTINENTVWTDFAKKAAIPYGQEGGFKDDKEARASLFSSLSKVNPLAAQELENNYQTGELKHMMGMAANNVERANQALAQGGPEGLRQLIDDTNGINNAQWETDDKGVPTLWEITPDGQKVRPIASGSTVDQISSSLQATLNPSTSLNVAKAMYDNQKTQAETEYYRAKAIAERSGKGLTKEQWAMARLAQNPNDEMGYAILLGAKYEPDQIPGLINKAGLQSAGAQVPDPAAANAVDSSKPLPTSDEVNKNTATGISKAKAADASNALINQIEDLPYAEALKLFNENEAVLKESGMYDSVYKEMLEKAKEEEKRGLNAYRESQRDTSMDYVVP